MCLYVQTFVGLNFHADMSCKFVSHHIAIQLTKTLILVLIFCEEIKDILKQNYSFIQSCLSLLNLPNFFLESADILQQVVVLSWLGQGLGLLKLLNQQWTECWCTCRALPSALPLLLSGSYNWFGFGFTTCSCTGLVYSHCSHQHHFLMQQPVVFSSADRHS